MAEVRTTSATGGQKGVKLARFDLIPQGPLTELAEHFGMGALKYANHQWRQGYEWSKSFAAKQRHDALFWAGYDYDVCSNDPDGCSYLTADGEEYHPVRPDTCYNHTGSHHMVASAWHAFVLLEFKDRFPAFDDRYKPDEDDAKYLEATGAEEPSDGDWVADYDVEVGWRDPLARTIENVEMARSGVFPVYRFICGIDPVEIEDTEIPVVLTLLSKRRPRA